MKKKFFDRIQLKLTSGNGGKGSHSLRREKYVPKGGPDGGDGGDGGNVIIEANKTITDFSHLARKRAYRAENGGDGMKKKKSGSCGKDFVVQVPLGTLIKTSEGITVGELTRHKTKIIALKGGKGGKGNVHYKTSVQQRPLKFQKGTLGSTVLLNFELLTIAQIALVGAPNAGKSTLLSHLTASLGKIANYPFTTLTPQLGMYRFPSEHRAPITLAEIPGLVEGASVGLGLGHHFLRHARKAAHFFFLVDASAKLPFNNYLALRKEVTTYEESLAQRPFHVLLTKCELISTSQQKELLREFQKKIAGNEVIAISCHKNLGIDILKKEIDKIATKGFAKLPSARFTQFDQLLEKI